MNLNKGDYVLATKYRDGDPRDQWQIGFFDSMTNHNPPRYNIVDSDGNLVRGNGFRRVKKIAGFQGVYLLNKISFIQSGDRSLWSWLRLAKKESE